MKRYRKWFFVASVVCLSLILTPGLASAQPGDPGDDPDAPIDGGISLLLAAGIGYGIKKANDSRKKNKTQELP